MQDCAGREERGEDGCEGIAHSNCDLCIIGAGAAGLASGIFAAQCAARSGRLDIQILEGAHTIGAKILVSGGGRCNVTHGVITPDDFHGTRHLIRNILAAFPVKSTIEWFASMGVELKREATGKLFPTTDKARTVLNALLRRCQDLGVFIRTSHRVTDIVRIGGPEKGTGEEWRFCIHHTQGEVRAKRVILATGGRSLARTGSDGYGYELAVRLGHHVGVTAPALVPLILEAPLFCRDLTGVSQEVALTSTVNGRVVDRRQGDLLWTHFGVSGPVVMDASRFWTIARAKGEVVELHVNFLPGNTQEQTREWFIEQARAYPRRSLSGTLIQRVPERFAMLLCRETGVDPHRAIAQLARENRDRLIGSLSKFRFSVERDRGWNHAEVTAGGVPLEEVDFRTMESKKVPGLYLVGEILDCDGRIGGFNFQWAWATGYVAGRRAAASR
ncbi:MAG: NAD(P)/FAD-dependent oxidoreductase [Nitrospiraceae bacterium]